MYEPWQIQLFGNLRVRQGERLITRFRSRQTGALLAYLAYHSYQCHSRECLIELFWPESEPETGRHNLSNALSSLRSQLEPPGVSGGSVIIADRFSVELNAKAVKTDTAEFEQAVRRAAQASTASNYVRLLTEAVEQYHGSLLPHYCEDWVAPERDRLQQRFVQAAGQLIGLLEKAGETERALEVAQRALSADPLREESHRDVMRLLAASGQPEEALRRFRELECLFIQELGERPSASAQQLAHQIKSQSAADPPSILPAAVPVGSAMRAQLSTPSLPTGTVTFLLTDIEGSTALCQRTGEVFRSALTTHHALVRREFRRNGGQEVKEVGDSFLVAFAGASDALHCAIACRRALASQPWPEALGRLSVRMALHTGDVEVEDGEYQGLVLHRAAQTLSAGHGGQILVSEATAVLLRRDLGPAIRLKDLGAWRLQNLEEPERLFQVETPGLDQPEFPPLNAEPAHTLRLPLQFTRFFGREAEISQLVEVLTLPTTRLLTLTGPGGIGKTRLCIEIAEQHSENFHGATWFVPLADLSDPEQIPQSILQAMSIPLTSNQAPLEQLVMALTKQPMMLVLDNFEQLVAGGAELVQILLSRVPALQCMVTSRQTLSLPGEVEFAVAPLPTPNGCDTPERLNLFESVRLFVDRAQAAKPDFRVTNSNAPTVAKLCDELEGIPLAIELAAARAQVLTPAQMLVQLGNRFEFLISRKRGIVERQRTLQATVDWSYRLLAPDLQRLFTHLCVFRGGWTPAAAEAICEEPLALDLLAQLKECSLVSTHESGGGIRFRMLESLRDFAQKQLSAEDYTLVRERHADYFLAAAEEAAPQLCRSEQAIWKQRLERDHDNLRAALEWCLTREGREVDALRLVGALAQFWVMGCTLEGRVWTTRALAGSRSAPPLVLAKALEGGATLAFLQGDHRTAALLSREEVEFARMTQDRWQIASALGHRAVLVLFGGEVEEAEVCMQEALPLSEATGDQWLIGRHLSNLGLIAWTRDDYQTARSMLRRPVEISRALNDVWFLGIALGNLAYVTLCAGEGEEARALHREALRLFQHLGDRAGIGTNLVGIARVEAKRDRADRAARLLGAAAAVLEPGGVPLPPLHQREHLRIRQQTRARLGDELFSLTWAEGRAMTIEQAIAFALEACEP